MSNKSYRLEIVKRTISDTYPNVVYEDIEEIEEYCNVDKGSFSYHIICKDGLTFNYVSSALYDSHIHLDHANIDTEEKPKDKPECFDNEAEMIVHIWGLDDIK